MSLDQLPESVRAGLASLQAYLPTLLTALALILAGWVLALLARRWSRTLAERLLAKLGGTSRAVGRAVEGSAAASGTPRLISVFVFWLTLLVFVAAAVETLGLPVMTDLLGRLAAYLPQVFAASLIVIGGLVLGRVVRAALQRTAETVGITQARALATIGESVVFVLAAVIALEQLGVNGRVLELTVAVIVGSALAAVALAFGLGARTSVSNLIASHYAMRALRIGQQLSIDGTRGTVIELNATSIVLETHEGRVLVPSRTFQERATLIVREEA